MTEREALKLALEALTNAYWPTQADLIPAHNIKECAEAITAIKEALAQPEPVAYMSHNKENFVSADDVGNSVPNWTDYYPTPLYTTPPPCPTCEALARTVMMD